MDAKKLHNIEKELQEIIGDKKNHFNVPKNYFEELSQSVLSETKTKNSPAKTINLYKYLSYAAAIAIIAVASFFIFSYKDNSSSDLLAINYTPLAKITTTDFEDELFEDEYDYLVLSDEDLSEELDNFEYTDFEINPSENDFFDDDFVLELFND